MTNREAVGIILLRYEEVAPYIDAAIEAADGEKDALGFFPNKVYYEFARHIDAEFQPPQFFMRLAPSSALGPS